MENERYLFVTSDDNVSKVIDFIWPVYKEIFGIEKYTESNAYSVMIQN